MSLLLCPISSYFNGGAVGAKPTPAPAGPPVQAVIEDQEVIKKILNYLPPYILVHSVP